MLPSTEHLGRQASDISFWTLKTLHLESLHFHHKQGNSRTPLHSLYVKMKYESLFPRPQTFSPVLPTEPLESFQFNLVIQEVREIQD